MRENFVIYSRLEESMLVTISSVCSCIPLALDLICFSSPSDAYVPQTDISYCFYPNNILPTPILAASLFSSCRGNQKLQSSAS